MVRQLALTIGLGIMALMVGVADEPSKAKVDPKPPYERMLTGADAKRAAELEKQAAEHETADRYPEAIKAAEELLALRVRLQQEDHWEVVDLRWAIDGLRTVAALSAEKRGGWRKAAEANLDAQRLEDKGAYELARPLREERLRWSREVFGENHVDTADSYNVLAANLARQARYADAQPYFQKALDIRRQRLGDNHPDIANSYNNLAFILASQGNNAEAQRFYQKALGIRRQQLGDHHMDTARSYNNLAVNYTAQGKYADAQPLLQKALDIRLGLLGKDHLEIANSYHSLAANLTALGKYADAQLLHYLALDIRRLKLGDDHPDTASAYSNLASNLDAQGKYDDAQPLLQKALKIHRQRLGDKSLETARSYNNLAYNLNGQGRYADAQPLYQNALDIYLGFFGDKHQNTATAYSNLASNLAAQGEHTKAQQLIQKAFDIRHELRGDNHPDTANSYSNLAVNLASQGKYTDAQRLFQKALDIRHELLGDNHPDTATSYTNIAYNLAAQGNYAEADRILVHASAAYETSRQVIAHRGLDRAVFGASKSPYRLLAATRAALRQPVLAWSALESDLARGLAEQAAERRGNTLTADEQTLRTTLATRMGQIQPRLVQLITRPTPTDAEKGELAKLQAERQSLEARLCELAVILSRREVDTLARVQAAIPADTALVAWVDATAGSVGVQEHWGCVIRSAGDPFWERLPGCGTEKAWTRDDDTLPRRLWQALVGEGTTAPASPASVTSLSRQLHAQRIAPLEKHLTGVTRLYLMPVGALAGVPFDVITDKYRISYVPSGTFLARVGNRPKPAGDRVLALGDPTIAVDTIRSPALSPLPPGGLLVTQVVPGGVAATARVAPGDVLLKYAGTDLRSADDLQAAIGANKNEKSVRLLMWRDGKVNDREVGTGRLGVVLDGEPAPVAIATMRKVNSTLTALRGGGWKELPGTRVELARLKALFGPDKVTPLTGAGATASALDALRVRDQLKEFRYLHFATHGEANHVKALESRLILSPSGTTGTALLRPDTPLQYGMLSAREVLDLWKLEADLVTLSACETALGRSGGGDGLLGFAQAFLTAGSRAVCLSLWKVDDAATALLMDRFYRNLLGKRPGLEKPLAKAAALQEAKQWLRALTTEEVGKLLGELTNGVPRGAGEPALKLIVPAAPAPEAKGDKPFAHPRYWAAFILIGDPD